MSDHCKKISENYAKSLSDEQLSQAIETFKEAIENPANLEDKDLVKEIMAIYRDVLSNRSKRSA